MSERAIICVDDEEIVLDSLREQIENVLGNDVLIETCESGQAALELLEELMEDKVEIPLVIADYIMPDMTGDHVLEKIYSRNKSTRTILLTGQANLKGIENAINKANLYRFISKPWDRDDLIVTIKEAIKSFDAEKTISRQYHELKDLNNSLEQKVEQRTKELQELNHTKDKFFSIIAHDLKNPFNTILGFSDLLIENYNSYSDEKRQDFIKLLQSTSKKAYDLLQNLLEWSRSQTGRIAFNPDVIDLNLVLNDILGITRSVALKKEIQVENKLKIPAQVYADENMVQTILRNLISNAIKFTDKNGKITISSENEGKFLIVSVSDTGIGIPKDYQDKIFRIDVNHSTKGTDNEEGTGLGLLLCKEFVLKHKGRIWLESEENKGTSFFFTLPLAKESIQK